MVFKFGCLELERDGLLEIENGRAVDGELAPVRGLPLVALLCGERTEESKDHVVVGVTCERSWCAL